MHPRSGRTTLISAFAVILLAFTLAGMTARAGIVTSTADDGSAGTLRSQIAAAAPGDTITFSVAGAINLTQDELVIDKNLIIQGPGANVLTVQRSPAGGTPTFRIFLINSGMTVTISGLTIANGNITNAGGGGIANAGTLTLSNCTVSGNFCRSGGAGIQNFGTITISNSTISGNSTVVNDTFSTNSDGGGIHSVFGTVTISNSTISGNSANGFAGGVLFENDTSATLTSVTITNNRADANGNGSGEGGGLICNVAPLLRNTVVARNFRGTGTTADDILTSVNNTSSFNLIGTGGAGGLTDGVNNNQVGVSNPRLAPLALNGGATQTHALLAGSTAIDRGDDFSASPSTDQRGAARPVDLADASYPNAADASDIGAYEAQSLPTFTAFLVNTVADTNDGVCDPLGSGSGNQDCTLREAINASNAAGSLDAINFDIPGAGQHTIQLTAVLAALSDSVDLDNTSGESITVRGEGAVDPYTIIVVNSGQTVNIANLTITNGGAGGLGNSGSLTITNGIVSGNVASSDGAGISSSGALILRDSTVSGNSATGSGGGIYNNVGTVTIANSTISGNSASGGGGILNVGPLTMTNSTLSGNNASGSGGGITGFAETTLRNVTVTNNRSDADDEGNGEGGGIFTSASLCLLQNTIVAGNFKGTGTAAADISGTVNNTSSFNLIGTGGAGGLTKGTNNNQVGVANPGLDPLAANGGPTETHALQAGSPAINAASNATASPRDQRGYARAGLRDIGAFEFSGVLFRVTAISRSGNDIVIGFDGLAGETYGLERKLSLTDLAWEEVPDASNVSPGADEPAQITDPGGANEIQAFYRVRVVP